MRHCAMNVALYGRANRWTMTERGGDSVLRDRDFLAIGPSEIWWDGTALTARINEIAVPWPSRVQGTIRLYPAAIETSSITLDAGGHHRWQPVAPCARAEVRLNRPDLSWSGTAYFDTNNGDRPLADDFVRWDWSRATIPGGTTIVYDIQQRSEGPRRFAMRYDTPGGVTGFDPGQATPLPLTRWRVPRFAPGAAPSVVATLEDTPFYARSLVSASLLCHPVRAMHETLMLDRFTAPWVQAMLPFRMPRIWWGGASSPARNDLLGPTPADGGNVTKVDVNSN